MIKTLLISFLLFVSSNLYAGLNPPKINTHKDLNRSLSQKRDKDLEIIKKIFRDRKIWNPFR